MRMISNDIFKYFLILFFNRIFRRHDFEVRLTEHAVERMLWRRIAPELIEQTIRNGKIIRFGKNRMKFEKKFKKFTLVCVDERVGNHVRIVTIVKR